MIALNASMLIPRRTPRGVVLLIILGMLAALALIGIAFTTFSAQEEDSSANFKGNFQTTRGDLDWTLVINEALSQLIADTSNPLSALRGHSLLRDMFGYDNDLGLGPDNQPGAAGTDDDLNGIIDDLSELGWGDDVPNGVVDVYDYFQRAFNGSGEAGPDGIVGPSGAAFDDADINYVFNGRNPEQILGATGYVRGSGADEDYDYPDYNNLFLAAVRADGTVLTPSFHRPGYLNQAGANDWTDLPNNAARGRRLILRPRSGFGPDGQPGVANVDDDGNGSVDDISERNAVNSDDLEHPLFPTTAFNGLDVDNMGLGRPDSIWIDIGFPVQETVKGRRFKPMVAFLVMDLDGKLNLNVHGNLAADKIDAAGAFQYPDRAGDGTPDSHADIVPGAGPGGSSHGGLQPTGGAILDTPYNDLPLGSGWSVTEVNLQNPFNPLFSGLVPTTINSNEYRWLLEGQWRPGPDASFGTADDILIPGRWGEQALLTTAAMPRAGATYLGSGPSQYADDTRPGYLAQRGNVSEGRPYNAPPPGNIYRTPPDFDGTGTLAINPLAQVFYLPDSNGPGVTRTLGWGGHPQWASNFPGPQASFETLDDSSELNPFDGQSTDALYTPRELELLYRYEDVDGTSLVQLFGPSTRLSALATSLFDTSDPRNRRRRFLLTTDSWDLARPNHPPLLPWQSTSTIAGNPAAGTGVFPFLNPQVPANRPFIAALPEAIRSGKRLPITPQFPSAPPPLIPTAQKYEFARALYMIMWSCSVDPNSTPPVTLQQSRRIAQWAVNCVDFSDTESGSDEVMTPFVYDVNPSTDADGNGNGWDVLSDPTDTTTGAVERAVVWGTEAPSVVINETFAYEDPQQPGTFALWIELYNPTSSDVELNGTNHTYQLVLDDRSPGPWTNPDLRWPNPGPPPQEGEPFNTTIMMDFSATFGSGATIIAPGQRLIVGPAGQMPASVGGGPFGTPSRFVPNATFAPGTAGIGPSGFRLYLRKLANPYQPNDQTIPYPNSANPYITVDALDVDCHPVADLTPDPVTGEIRARSLERRTLNVVYWERPAGPTLPRHSIGDESPADDAAPFNTAAITADVNDDGVLDPWPWLVFNDRPFASPMELLLVPGVGPQHLTTTFFYPMPNTVAPDHYNPLAVGQVNNTSIVTGTPPRGAELSLPFRELGTPSQEYLFGHLLNFFREDPISPAVPRPGYYRLFEYVEAPSRINGTSDPFPGIASRDMSSRARHDRVPAKININTIWEQETFQAALNNHPLSLDASATWVLPTTQIPTYPGGMVPESAPGQAYTNLTSDLYRRILLSIANPGGDIAGDAETPARLFTLNDRPFRSFSQGVTGATPPATPNSAPVPNIQSTFFRGLAEGALTAFPTRTPVFEDDRGRRAGSAAYNPPGFTPTPPTRNDLLDYPYFRWQVMQKMSNVFTTRSNVYAVWVTVGFFEVLNEDPNRLFNQMGVRNAPPELGPELDFDIGRNVRHRAFFIIDRSQARGYTGPPRSSKELQDILSQVLVYSRIIE